MRILHVVLVCTVLGVSAGAVGQQTPPAIQAGPEERGDPEPRTGVIVTVPPESYDRVADEAGEIYTTRGYKGVVPGIRDQSAVPAKSPETQVPSDSRAIVDWVGFQPFPTYSRVFIQVSGAFTFAVTRPAQDRIEVRIPAADVSTSNDLHELVTRNFPTAVDRVVVGTSQKDEGAVIVTVFLKAPVGYLYRQDGGYIFIDVEL